MKQFAAVLLVIVLSGSVVFGQDSLNVSSVGILNYWNSAQLIEIEDDYAYLTCYYGGLYIVDISDPANPVETGSLFYQGSSSALASSQGIVYLSLWDGDDIYIIDATDPANPVWADSLNLPVEMINDLEIQGDYLFAITSNPGKFYAIDISVPSLPVIADPIVVTSSNDMYIQGNRIYSACMTDGMEIIDISNPRWPYIIGSYTFNGEPNSVAAEGDIAYFVVEVSGTYNYYYLQTLYTADPNDIRLISDVYISDWQNLKYIADVSDNILFIRRGTISVYDMSTPQNPISLGNWGSLDGYMQIIDNTSFLFEPHTGFMSLDISDPVNPDSIGILNNFGKPSKICLEDNYAYIGAYDRYDWNDDEFIFIVDICDPEHPQHLKRIPVDEDDGFIRWLTINEGYLYFQCQCLKIYQITAGDSLTLLNQEDNSFRDVEFLGDYAVFADFTDGIKIYDVSDPESGIFQIGELGSIGSIGVVSVQGNYLYAGDYAGSVIICDISNPTTPVLIETVVAGYGMKEICADGNLLHIAKWDRYLVYDISNPAAPVLLDQYDTGPELTGMQVLEHQTVIHDYNNGIYVIDFWDPQNLQLTGFHPTAGKTADIVVRDNYIFSCEEICLQVFDITQSLGIEPDVSVETVPSVYNLSTTYPNPFNSSASFSFELPINSPVNILVYDLLGREAATIFKGKKSAGVYKMHIDGSNIASGIYFLKMESREFTQTQKIILLK